MARYLQGRVRQKECFIDVIKMNLFGKKKYETFFILIIYMITARNNKRNHKMGGGYYDHLGGDPPGGLYTDLSGDLYEVKVKPEHDVYTIEEYLATLDEFPLYEPRSSFESLDYYSYYTRILLLFKILGRIIERDFGKERLEIEAKKFIDSYDSKCNCDKEKKELKEIKSKIQKIFDENSSDGLKKSLKEFLDNETKETASQRSSAAGVLVASAKNAEELLKITTAIVKALELELKVK
jgi:hypothetical protein